MGEAVKTSSLLIVCGLMFGTTLLITASAGDGPQAGPSSQAGASMEAHVATCGGEPCDAVARGFLAFFDRKLEGLGANGRACADCHMPTDNFQLSPANAEARFRLLQLRRRFNPSADDPLFRPIDADDFRINGDQANDFSNLRQNGLVRITFALPPNLRLIDPATNAPSAETFVDVWRSVPTVNDVALTGPDAGIAWPRGPNTPADTSWTRDGPRSRNRRWAPLPIMRRLGSSRLSNCSTTWPRSSASCSRIGG